MTGLSDPADPTTGTVEGTIKRCLKSANDLTSRPNVIEELKILASQHVQVMTEKTFNECWCLLYKYGQAEEASALAFAYLELHPVNVAAHLRAADSCELPRQAKRSMHHYSEAALLELESDKESAIVSICIHGIIRCSRYTDFGPQMQEGELSEWKAHPEFYTDTQNNFMDPELRGLIQNAFADRVSSTSIDDFFTSVLSIPSDHRLFLQSARGLYKLPRFFRWMIPFRLAVMGTPKSAEDIVILRERLGISTIITLTEEQPLPGKWFENELSKNIFIPVRDYHAPKVEQIDDFIRAVTSLPHDEAALVHCGAGKGRAGTFAACYLIARGFWVQASISNAGKCPFMFPRDAIRLVRRMRPGSIESTEQEDFIKAFGARLLRTTHIGPPLVVKPVKEPADPLEIPVGVLHPIPSLIVCCGLQGSGKSTFAAQLAAHLGYTVISQDTLGNRSACLAALANTVKDGKRVVVDLCNPKPDGREEWLACAFHPSDAVCAWFDVKVDVCVYRANARTNHPTIAQGKAKNIITSLSKTFVRPSSQEEFACIARIGSIHAVNELLNRLGVVGQELESTPETQSTISAPPSPQPITRSETVFHKFPRTRHLIDVGAATGDDLVLQTTDINAFLDTSDPSITVTLEEKVDGANMGFTLDPSAYTGFRAQSRGRFLEYGVTEKQFQKVDKWVIQHSDGVRRLLLGPDRDAQPGRYILYGEWVLARHAISYSRLPDYFIAFDLYDTEEDSFLSRQELSRRLEGTRIQQVPAVPTPEILDEQALRDLVAISPSRYYEGAAEGLYLRREKDGKTVDRAKIVRADFTPGNPNFKRRYTENIIIKT